MAFIFNVPELLERPVSSSSLRQADDDVNERNKITQPLNRQIHNKNYANLETQDYKGNK